MKSYKYGFPMSAARLVITALVIGIMARALWEALKFGWSFLGIAA